MIAHWQAHPLGFAHVAVAVLAILFGTLVIAARKGTAYHRRMGRAYFASMLAVNITALAIYELFGRFGPFHWMALASLATLIVGYLPTKTRSPGWLPRHAYFMAGSYVGLLAALASEIFTRVPGVAMFEGVAVASTVVIVAGVWLMIRRIPGILGARPGP